jgi:hypothetical protein
LFVFILIEGRIGIADDDASAVPQKVEIAEILPAATVSSRGAE